MQERCERIAGRAPVQALERTVVEHAVDPPHLLVENGVERTALGQELAHDAVAVLFRPALPRVVRLREVDLDPERLLELLEEAVLGHALGLLVPVSFLALVCASVKTSSRPTSSGGRDPALGENGFKPLSMMLNCSKSLSHPSTLGDTF